MKALIWKTKEPGDVGVVETPAPVPSDGKVSLKPLVTAVFSLDDALQAFELARNGRGVCKVMIRP